MRDYVDEKLHAAIKTMRDFCDHLPLLKGRGPIEAHPPVAGEPITTA